MSDEEEKVLVEFSGTWTKYFPGDVAGFEPFLAKRLLGMKMVDPRGNKAPLCRKYKAPFLERAGIVKGDKPVASEPIGGTEDKVVVTPESEELAGGPARRKRGRGRK